MTRTPSPKPGVYPGVSFEEYASWDALNHSTLKHAAKTASHFKAARDNPDTESTPALAIGTAAHALLLEPERFKRDVVAAPINPKTGNAFGRGTKAWEEHADAHKGKIILTTEELTDLRAMAAKIHANPDASTLLTAEGMSEVAIVWDDPTTGLRCKARVDRYVPAFGRIDYKTTESAADGDLQRSFINYSYHTADVFYSRGFEALKMNARSVFIVQEKSAPYEARVVKIGGETLQCAEVVVGEWLELVARCVKSGEWPGYSEGVHVVDAPEFYFKKFANALD